MGKMLYTGNRRNISQKKTRTESFYRDCTMKNIMFDPSGMYPKGYHPIKLNRSQDFKRRAERYTRTARPPRYYLIDFGLSRQYSSRNTLDQLLRLGDMSTPEHKQGGRYNPFCTDIYYLGNLVREHFLLVRLDLSSAFHGTDEIVQKYNGFEFIEELVDAMRNDRPTERPTIEEVVEKFDSIRRSLSPVKLRSPITSKEDPMIFTMFRHAIQLARTLRYVIQRRPAVPVPP